jgi:tRNA threonylcarbamoyl adenosine modification protein YeaZ
VAVLADALRVSAVAEPARQEVGCLSLIERVLREAGVDRGAVDCIAIGLGPGSYAGIRSGIALAYGWRVGRRVRVMGVSSMEVLAREAAAAGARGAVNLVVDAQRGEVYLTRHWADAGGHRLVEPLRLAAGSVIASLGAAGERVFSSDPGLVKLGAEYLLPSAATLALLAWERRDAAEVEQLEPITLRTPSFLKAPLGRSVPPAT